MKKDMCVSCGKPKNHHFHLNEENLPCCLEDTCNGFKSGYLHLKVYWDEQKTLFGAIKEFDDDASKYYQESSTGFESIFCEPVELKTDEDVDKLFARQDGDGDDSGYWGRSIMLICTEEDEVLFKPYSFETTSSYPSFSDYEDHVKAQIRGMIREG